MGTLWSVFSFEQKVMIKCCQLCEARNGFDQNHQVWWKRLKKFTPRNPEAVVVWWSVRRSCNPWVSGSSPGCVRMKAKHFPNLPCEVKPRRRKLSKKSFTSWNPEFQSHKTKHSCCRRDFFNQPVCTKCERRAVQLRNTVYGSI